MKIVDEKEFPEVVSAIKKVMDFDPDNYKFRPLRRRVWSRMRRLDIDSYREYSDLLLKNSNEVSELKKALTINLTRFFRNKEVFDILRDDVFPKFEHPGIWSAGCASGAEPYAVAIMCLEMGKDCKILGTDIDSEEIIKAREGIYREDALVEVDASLRRKYFEEEDGLYRISDDVKKMVNIERKDLKDTNYRDRFDLIICRNVLIYLKKEFQIEIIDLFYRALKRSGILVLGRVESIPRKIRKRLKPVDLRNRIYEKE